MNEELELFRENVERFIADEIQPHYDQWERDEIIPRQLWNKLGEQGLLCVDIPREYGGTGADYLFSTVILEAFSRANCGGVGGPLAVSDIVSHYVLNNGTEEQKQKYLPKMVTGECVSAIAMTEPGAGSDLQGIRTTARKDGDDYIINGSKTFISNGQHCDMVAVVARTNPDVAGAKGTTLLIVDKDMPGFQRGRNLVPASAILGELDRGFMVLMNELPRERLSLAIAGVAAAEGILAQTVEYVKERKAFGGTIASLQNTRFTLADVATKIRINRSFVEECKQLFMAGKLDPATVSMAKLSVTEMQGEVADTCLQLFGGYGYMSISRAYVDARVQRIYGGTSEIMKELISRAVLA